MRIEPVAYVAGGFPERFGTPRQPRLTPHARCRVVLVPPYDDPDALRGLAGCSHVWLVFGFHQTLCRGWSPTVRPPRLGGNRRVGVFATRSPFRPNALGQSAVELVDVHVGGDWRGLAIANHDLLDGTPVYDIRPYMPYSDAIPAAVPPPGFEGAPAALPVRFEMEAERALARLGEGDRALISEVLAADPRPAVQRDGRARRHAVRLFGRDIHWYVSDGEVVVEAITEVADGVGSQ